MKHRNGTSTGISVIPGAHNEAFEEDIVNAEINKPENAENQQKSIHNHGNEKLRKLEEGDSIRISKLTALTLLALSKEHSSHESEKMVDLDFLDEQVTDLDELSNPRSPGLVLTSGSPRRDFSYSETRLDTIHPGNKALETELNTQLSEETRQMSRSSHVLNEVTPSSVNSINDYINLSYPDRNLKNTVNENESTKEDMEAIKKTFVSRYSLQFLTKNDDSPSLIQNSPASSTSSVSGAGSLRGAPRRQSYTLAISSDEEGTTLAREVLSASSICESSFYDVPRNSGGFEVDEFKTESKETDSEDRAPVNADYEITDIFTSVESGQRDQLDNSALSSGLNGGVERGNITPEKENSGLNHDETKSDSSNEQRDSIGAYF